MAVVNLDENQWRAGNWPNQQALRALCAKLNVPMLELCVEMELEISRLPEEDKLLFMEDMNIEQPGIDVLARGVYGLLGLISFLTAGEDEVRAWTIEKGTIAKNAAGKIHSDIERGFIRAEVVKFDDIKELGSMAKVKEKGLFRLEGKEYTVLDGDIVHFRFNV
jgi:ribosome-binding ATPase YchF (GTP1/OBG family)